MNRHSVTSTITLCLIMIFISFAKFVFFILHCVLGFSWFYYLSLCFICIYYVLLSYDVIKNEWMNEWMNWIIYNLQSSNTNVVVLRGLVLLVGLIDSFLLDFSIILHLFVTICLAIVSSFIPSCLWRRRMHSCRWSLLSRQRRGWSEHQVLKFLWLYALCRLNVHRIIVVQHC